MKRIDLERYLRERGCLLYREGSGHSSFEMTMLGLRAFVRNQNPKPQI
jgi:hypothetical protein